MTKHKRRPSVAWAWDFQHVHQGGSIGAVVWTAVDLSRSHRVQYGIYPIGYSMIFTVY